MKTLATPVHVHAPTSRGICSTSAPRLDTIGSGQRHSRAPRSCRFQPDAETCEERMMTMRKTLLSAAVAVLGLALPAARVAAADAPKIDFAKQIRPIFA